LNTFTWNHTVAAFVKAAPDLHHYPRHNWTGQGKTKPEIIRCLKRHTLLNRSMVGFTTAEIAAPSSRR